MKNDYLPEITEEYFQMNLGNILFLLNKHIAVDTDSLIHDYLIQLRYQLTQDKAKEVIIERVKEELKSIDSDDTIGLKVIDILLNSIYYQMCVYGLYNKGELDYRLVKTRTIHVHSWQDEFTPVFECIDRVNTDNLVDIERQAYLIF